MSSRDGRGSRAGDSGADKPPLYARLLRLKHIRPGPWWCFLFFEGSLAVAGVLVLAGWVSPWGLLVLPVGVAIAVKLNDVVTGALPPAGAKARRTTTPAAKSRPKSKAKSDSKSTEDSSMPAASTSTADSDPATVPSDEKAADRVVTDSETEGDQTAEDQTAKNEATENDAGGNVAGENVAGDRDTAEHVAPDTPPGGSPSAIRAVADTATENDAAGGKSTSDRGAAARSKRNAIRATSARSRRIAGSKTTAPTRSGSTPAKEEG